MRFVLTALIFMAGLFDLTMAASFLFQPTEAAAGLGVTAISLGGGAERAAAGLSTLRADFAAFFGVAAVCMMWGAWHRNGDLLLVPLLLFATALAGRALGLAMEGVYPGWWVPMAVEALHVGVLAAARRLLPHHPLEEITA